MAQVHTDSTSFHGWRLRSHLTGSMMNRTVFSSLSIDKGEKLNSVQAPKILRGVAVAAALALTAAAASGCGGSGTATGATSKTIDLVAYSTPDAPYAKL